MDGNLKFFRILNLLKLYSFPILLCLLVIRVFFFEEKIQQSSLLSFYFAILLVYSLSSFNILKIISNGLKTTPKKIILILCLEFSVSIILWIIWFFFIDKVVLNDVYQILIWNFLYFIFWVIYFLRSKHVSSYYNLEK